MLYIPIKTTVELEIPDKELLATPKPDLLLNGLVNKMLSYVLAVNRWKSLPSDAGIRGLTVKRSYDGKTMMTKIKVSTEGVERWE